MERSERFYPCDCNLRGRWEYCPHCGRPLVEPESGTEVILRGLLDYHRRLKNTEGANGSGDSPVADIYEASLIDAIMAVREREENQ